MSTRKSIKKSDRREWFKYRLRLRKSSFAKLAKQLQISRAAVSKGILKPSPRLAEAVEADLDTPKSELWPELFTARRTSL